MKKRIERKTRYTVKPPCGWSSFQRKAHEKED